MCNGRSLIFSTLESVVGPAVVREISPGIFSEGILGELAPERVDVTRLHIAEALSYRRLDLGQ